MKTSNSEYYYISYEEEKEIMNLFFQKNIEKLKSKIALRQETEKQKDIDYDTKMLRLIMFITSLSREIIHKGVPAEQSLVVAENLINLLLAKDNTDYLYKFEYQIIEFFSDIYFDKSRQVNPTVIKILNYIHKNKYESITIKDIADYLKTSESYISNVFQQSKKMTIKQYINYIKIEHAKQLLETSDESLLDISIQLSYSSQSYFNRVFKKFTGLTPNEFRKNKNRENLS